MIGNLAVGVALSLLIWACVTMMHTAPKFQGSPQVISPRIRLKDGRYLAYRETGVKKEEAKHKIIFVHGFNGSKDMNLPISQDLVMELGIYILSFDRAGYGESDPNPRRSVKSEAYDIQELANRLEIGQKFFILGVSLGAYPVWSCLRYIPERLLGASLVVPHVNYWWPCYPSEVAKAGLRKHLLQDQWSFYVAHYTPWLFNLWMTQKWIPTLSLVEGNIATFSCQDLEIVKRLSHKHHPSQEKVRHQNVYESLYRDVIVGFSNWGFDPTGVANPFPNNEGSVDIWQGYEDRIIPFELNRFLSHKLPWIRYQEVPDAGHLLIYNSTNCEAVFRKLLSA